MCLVKKHRLPKILPWRKWVYKIVLVRKGNYYSPYYSDTQIVPYIPMKAKLPWKMRIFKKYIEGEGIHAFSNIKSAKWNIKRMPPAYLCSYKIVKAYIPRFTPYWTGRGGEIASSTLIVTGKEM